MQTVFLLLFLPGLLKAEIGSLPFKTASNPKKVSVEVARTKNSSDRAKGLSGIKKLRKNQGMLFEYEKSDYLAIWALETWVDLDVAFLDAEKRIIAIDLLPATPELWNKEDPDFGALRQKARYSPLPSLYVLEMEGGWFKENDIHVGDRLSWGQESPLRVIIKL